MKLRLFISQVYADSVWPVGSELDVDSSTGAGWIESGAAEEIDIPTVAVGIPAEPVEEIAPVADGDVESFAVSTETAEVENLPSTKRATR